MDDNESTPFNMAMLFYYRLNELLREKDRAYVQGDLPTLFKCLKSIFRNIIFKIKEPEELLNKFVEAEKHIMAPQSASNRYQAQQTGRAAYPRAERILEEIDIKLMQIMDKYNMIFPKIEVKNGLEEIRKKLKLT